MKKYTSNNSTKIDIDFLNQYWRIYERILFNETINDQIINIKNTIIKVNQNKGKVFIVGNGASASLASHAATDLTKQAKIVSQAFNDHNLITAFANDYGYDNWVKKALEFYCNPSDLIIFISVSGTSKNLVKGLEYAKNKGIISVSLTGSEFHNPLRKNCDHSLWVDSKSYNIVESIHTIYITIIIDLIIGKHEYSVV